MRVCMREIERMCVSVCICVCAKDSKWEREEVTESLCERLFETVRLKARAGVCLYKCVCL